MLFRNQKCVLSIIVSLFIVLILQGISYAQEPNPAVGDRIQALQDAILEAVPNIDDAANVTAAHLAAITELDLSGQEITSLPSNNFNGLTGLTHLDLSNNELTTGVLFPRHFNSLTSLTFLDLSHNELTLNFQSASVFQGLTELTELRLNDNQLGNLNIGGNLLGHLTKLEVLHLQNNRLVHPLGGSFGSTPFTGLTKLRELDLSGNQLNALTSYTFRTISADYSGSTTLEKLDLSNNLLAEVGEGEFAGLTALTELHLSDNLLTELPVGVFQAYFDSFDNATIAAPAALTKLYLDMNSFTTLPDGVFEGLIALTELTLPTGTTLPISLEKVADGQFKAVAAAGAPFEIDVPVWVTGGTINGGATSLTIPIGTLESGTLTVTRTAAPTVAVTANIGTLPSLPAGHSGYTLTGGGSSLAVIAAVADTTPPTVSITVPSGAQNSAFTVTVTFTESVTDFAENELVVGGTASTTVSSFTGSGTTYTATITPTTDGTVTLSVAANVAEDAANNGNTAATTQTVNVDVTGPGVSITAVRSGAQNSAFAVTVTFTEPVTGFGKSKLSARGAGATVNLVVEEAPQNRTTYNAAIRPTTDGTVMISVDADRVRDDAGNGNTASNTLSVLVDMTRPTVRIDVPTGVQKDAFRVTVEFNEPVTGFTPNDVSVIGAGATVTAFSEKIPPGDGTTYFAVITPTESGTVTLNVRARVAQDTAGNDNTAAPEKEVTVDRTRPTVSITVPTGVQGGAFDVTVEFDESVTDFVQSDLRVSGAAGADDVSNFTGSGTTYTATITPDSTGTVTLRVSANVAEDAVGNGNRAAPTKTVTVDMTDPTVTINAPTTTQGGAFDVTVVFGEPVTGFVQSELVVGGTATTTVAANFPTSGDTYTARITPTTNGRVTLNVAAEVAQDAVGNKNTAATEKTVQIDVSRPGVSISAPTTPQNSAFNVTVTFTESVTGFEQNELRVSGAGASVTDFSGSGITYEATITPTTDGTVTLTITANVAQDGGDNGNTATTTIVDVDMTPPSVHNIVVPTEPQNGAFPVTVIFTEPVTGFVQSDLEASGLGAAVTDFEEKDPPGDGTTYTATITISPTANGVVTLYIEEGVVEDTAGNQTTGASGDTVEIDTNRPGVTIEVPTGVQPKTFDVTVVFTESVTGFEQSELDVSGPAGAYVSAFDETTLSGSDTTTYQATITSTESGTVTLSVAENVAEDTATNGNTATAESKSVTVDLTRPTVGIEVPTAVQTGAFGVTVKFNEPVTDFMQSELRVSGAADAGDVSNFSGSGKTYEATITPRRSGTVTLNVNEDAAQDDSNNGNAAAATKTVTVDMDRPEVSINPPNGTQIGAFIVEVVFTEPVTGFVQSELGVSGAGAYVSTFFGSGTTYTATITPGEAGTVTLNVAANVAQDHVGHENRAASEETVEVTNPANENPLVGRTPEVTAAIVEELGISPADVETADLKGITLLDLRGKLKSGSSNIGQRNLPRNASERLSAQDFAGLSKMEVLVLSDNELASLPPGIFDPLTSLTHLILSHNELASLPPGIFDPLTSLTHLHLDDNKLGKNMTPLDEGVFSNLTTLENLHLNNNELESLPSGIFNGLTRLTTLYLQLNRFTEIPDRLFQGLTSLEWLWVEDAQRPLPFPILLEMVGRDQFRVVAPIGAPFEIDVPVFIENGFFPTTGEQPKTDVDGNPILTIPAGALHSEDSPPVKWDEDAIFAAIVKIGREEDFEIEDEFVGEDFFDEDIETLPSPPQWFHQGYKLTPGSRLVFTDLGGREPPTEEEVALGISPVDEEGNEHLLTGRTAQVVAAIIAEVPGATTAADVTAEDLAEIEDLLMVGKGITELKVGDFEGLSALTHLSLQRNGLTSIPEGIFDEGLTKLEILTLTENELTSLPANIFDGLSALKTLSISNNELTELQAGIFEELTSLRALFIAFNELTELPDGIFVGVGSGVPDNFTPLGQLSLLGNPGTVDTPVGNIRYRFLISLERVADGQFKVKAPKGATFDYEVGLEVENGEFVNLETNLFDTPITTIPFGSVESETITVTRTPGTTDPVTVRIATVPNVKDERGNHHGYRLEESPDPLVVFAAGAGAPAFTEHPSTVVEETTLLSNYPNPFNPETWIPYQLAEAGDVTVTIYDMRGVVIRQLVVGHQPMGVYRSRSRAVHWDGRNQFGEKVATGLYFYTLKAGDFTATRKMLIAK